MTRFPTIPTLAALLISAQATAPARAQGAPEAGPVVLRPARVFDGVAAEAREGWSVVVRGGSIVSAGPSAGVAVPEGARVVDLPVPP